MHTLLTMFLATSGALVSTWGFFRALRHRVGVRQRLRSVRGRRTGVALFVVGGVLLLVPDLIAGLVVAAEPAADSPLAVLGVLGALVWRAAVLLGLMAGGGVLWLTSEQVSGWIRVGVSAAQQTIPRRADLVHVRARRRGEWANFPREWEALVEHDRALARRLLGQGNHFEAAVLTSVGTSGDPAGHRRSSGPDLSALRDWSDPMTRAALEALVECDRVRTASPPPGTRDLLGSEYGRAVAAFDQAVRAAEDNARARGA